MSGPPPVCKNCGGVLNVIDETPSGYVRIFGAVRVPWVVVLAVLGVLGYFLVGYYQVVGRLWVILAVALFCWIFVSAIKQGETVTTYKCAGCGLGVSSNGGEP